MTAAKNCPSHKSIRLKIYTLYLMSFLFVLAGANHFRVPEMYKKIIPPYLPRPDLLNSLSGAAEITLGILLIFPSTRMWAAWGVIALLIAVFPANFYMYQARETVFASLPGWLLFVRLPLQLLLVLWAYWYT
jgi:uncharacterized membrane protein